MSAAAEWPQQLSEPLDVLLERLEEPMKVAKWGHAVPLADGTCHCGRSLRYNLRARIVGHVEGTVESCPEPWPNLPAPEEYELSRRMAEAMERGGRLLDRIALSPERLGDDEDECAALRSRSSVWRDEPPEHRAARGRTDEERHAIDSRLAAEDG
jgi:hypothetical protein